MVRLELGAYDRLIHIRHYRYTGKATCPICSDPLLETSQSLLLLFLCRHVVHGRCATKNSEGLLANHADAGLARSGISGRIALYVVPSKGFLILLIHFVEPPW